MIRVIGPRQFPARNVPQRNIRGVRVVNTTSRGSWKGLSPFFIGPCNLYGGYVAKNMENAWQFAKVYARHVGPKGTPTEDYFDWAKVGWADRYAHRYPMGRGARPEFSWWDGNALGYVEARKVIYVPLYIKAVVQTKDFQKLRELYKAEGQLILWDFDGWPSNLSFKEKLNDPSRKLGHGHVLAELLRKMAEPVFGL